MIYEYKKIEHISPEELDKILAIGWYRLGQRLITLDNFFSRYYYWLRVNMSIVSYNKAQKRVLKKAQHFTISLADWEITDEIEMLWCKYKGFIDFVTSKTATDYLFSDTVDYNRFNTKMITIRDNEKLIAVGYFDLGKSSSTAILHFYDPEYNSYSLGKLLLLLEMDYSNKNGIDFYYTGYLSLYDCKYDYKLFCGKEATEVYLKEDDRWEPYKNAEGKGLLQKVKSPFHYDDNVFDDYYIDFDELGFNNEDNIDNTAGKQS